MCEEVRRRRFPSFNVLLLIALALGVCCGFFQIPLLSHGASTISHILIKLLKLLSLPMIFLSIVATISGMQSFSEIRTMGRRVLVYTVATTLCAALVGLCLFWLLHPATAVPTIEGEAAASMAAGSYTSILLDIFPANIVQVFLDNHVIGVMLIAVTLGLASLGLPKEQKHILNGFFSALFSAILKVTRWLVYLMPLCVWAFVTLFTEQILREDPKQLQSFFLYICCVLGANLFQGVVVLPLFVKMKGISPLRLAKGSLSALTMAFFTRSSNATLPVTMQCAQEKLGLSSKVSNFSLPLCATINMNACASFILVTVLYVGTSQGLTFSITDGLVWAAIATLAAIGNAGVPMGCYFLASALLATLNVPLTLMGMILPVYTFFDMVETSLNVWSDICVAAVVDKDSSAAEKEIEIQPAAQ